MRLPPLLRHPFVLFALGLLYALFLLHMAGGREDVALLSGTRVGGPEHLALGLAYALAWFSAVLVAPVLLIAAALEALVDRVLRARLQRR